MPPEPSTNRPPSTQGPAVAGLEAARTRGKASRPRRPSTTGKPASRLSCSSSSTKPARVGSWCGVAMATCTCGMAHEGS